MNVSRQDIPRAFVTLTLIGLLAGMTGCTAVSYKAKKASPVHDTKLEKVEKDTKKAARKVEKEADKMEKKIDKGIR